MPCADGSGDMREIQEAYGPGPRQFGEWFLPNASGAPLVVMIHGGYWRPVYRLDIEAASARALAEQGFAVWSLEYRTYESGWPSTFTDIAAAIDFGVRRAASHGVDATRRALLGHSAGGALAAWATSRRGLPEGASGADATAPLFDLTVLSAPVACLSRASADSLGKGAVDTLMGGRPEDVPERYAVSDPCLLTPDPGRRLILHGDADDDVPLSQSEGIREHLTAHGQPADLIVLPGDDHYRILDPTSAVSLLRREALADALGL